MYKYVKHQERNSFYESCESEFLSIVEHSSLWGPSCFILCMKIVLHIWSTLKARTIIFAACKFKFDAENEGSQDGVMS